MCINKTNENQRTVSKNLKQIFVIISRKGRLNNYTIIIIIIFFSLIIFSLLFSFSYIEFSYTKCTAVEIRSVDFYMNFIIKIYSQINQLEYKNSTGVLYKYSVWNRARFANTTQVYQCQMLLDHILFLDLYLYVLHSISVTFGSVCTICIITIQLVNTK